MLLLKIRYARGGSRVWPAIHVNPLKMLQLEITALENI